MSLPRPFNSSLLALTLVVFLACQRAPEGPKLVPAAGVVTLDGKPLGSADVMLIPQGDTKGNGGVGRTDAAGKFELQTHDRQHKGIPVGEYKVIVSKLVKPDGTDYVPDPNVGPIDTGGFKELLPTAYTDQERSQLTATIPDTGNPNLEFKLNSKAR
jgi:hypothetical protein